MTFREKLKQDNPEFTEEQINKVITNCCPDTYSYEDESDCDCVKKQGDKRCESCWNREIPNTEFEQKVANPPSQEVLDTIRENVRQIPQEVVEASQNGYAQGKAEGYEKGLNVAWELARKLYHDIEHNIVREIFEIEGNNYTEFGTVLKSFTPQEALAKLKAYEEQSKVVVGDVVKCKGYSHEYVVMATSEETFSRQPFLRCTEPPYEVSYGSDEDLIKTGKHINILEQIGE